MSKKNRQKKKKKLKLQKKISNFIPAVKIENEESIGQEEQSKGRAKSPEKTIKDDSIIDEPTRKLISKDVKMIIITLAGLVLILVTVMVLQQKTVYMNTFGNWLYKITNIQTM